MSKRQMVRQTYKQAYERAKLDLVQHLKKRAVLDQEIRRLIDTLKPLGQLCGTDPDEIDKLLLTQGFASDSSLGFTATIRRLFRTHKMALNPTQIRDDLLKLGIGQEQVNLLSSIHTVLRRMVEAGEIERTPDARFQLVD
jgi:hypothetical protein